VFGKSFWHCRELKN